MKLSLGISVAVHVAVLAAAVFFFSAVPKMRLPEAVYSVKLLRPIVGAQQGAAAREAPKEEPKVEAPREKPKPKPKPEEKIPVPKKPDAKPAENAKSEAPAPPAERPMDVGVGAEDGVGVAVDAAAFPFSYYLAAIERKVSENWFSAVSEGTAGLACVVFFRLQRNGGIADARIETPSGNAHFDRAALAAVKSSAPFPPLPRAYPAPELGIHFTFVQKD